jgi:hypothetical protein
MLADVSAHLDHPEDDLQALAEAHPWWNSRRNACGKRKSIIS